MHVYYTNIKSDSYSQFGVDADLVGVGSLKVAWPNIFPRAMRATTLQPHHTKIRPWCIVHV